MMSAGKIGSSGRQVMRKLLILLVLISLWVLQATLATADDLIFDTFDDWKNPNVANGWASHNVGGWGGEFNQIYDAAQEMTCGPGETSYYRSIYKDFAVTGGTTYSVTFDYVGSATFKGWLQFYDAQNQLLFTAGSEVPQNSGVSPNKPATGFLGGYVPAYWVSGGGSRTYWTRGTATAPAGATRMRLVFQAYGGRAVAMRNVVLHEAHQAVDAYGNAYWTYEKIAGPFINRNTEFSQGINQQLGVYTFGNLSGEYKLRPAGGSSQGMSSGGTFNDYRSIYRDLKVTPGVKYKVTVDVISNSTNETGTRTPSPVRIWLQYNGLRLEINNRYVDTVLSTHGIDGTQAGIKDNEWTTVTVPGDGNAPYTVAPEGATRARIVLQVMGGTGGGTIFDNVSLTRYEQ
jgi:hypothetical protein